MSRSHKYSPLFFRLSILLVVVMVSTACRTGQAVPETQGPRTYADPVLANTALGLDLYRHVSESDGNIVYSPLSISMALAMTQAGARGETAEQIAGAIRFDGDSAALEQGYGRLTGLFEHDDAGELSVSLANSLWVQMGLSYGIDFLQTLERSYDSEMRQVDFRADPEESRRLINAWVAENTRDLIDELLPRGIIRPQTRLVLVNALYFKGAWVHAFPEGNTRPAPFHIADKQTSEVPMMRQKAQLRHRTSGDHDIVELPYADGDFSMVVIMPKRTTTAHFLSQTTPGALQELFDGLELGRVQLGLPRFDVTSPIPLRETLIAVGMPLPFDPDQADFSPITREEQLYLDNVVHEATITVDEKGTEAAAATAAIIAVESEGPPEKVVNITFDRPFVFFLRDRQTSAVLFMGEIVDPS
ncbi:MAG: serpin family protein [Bradymonadaceae bacterium]